MSSSKESSTAGQKSKGQSGQGTCADLHRQQKFALTLLSIIQPDHSSEYGWCPVRCTSRLPPFQVPTIVDSPSWWTTDLGSTDGHRNRSPGHRRMDPMGSRRAEQKEIDEKVRLLFEYLLNSPRCRIAVVAEIAR